MILIVHHNVALEADLVLRVRLNKLAVLVLVQSRKCVIIHRIDRSCALTGVKHLDLSEVVTLVELADKDLLAFRVSYSYLAVSLADKVEGRISCIIVALAHDLLMRGLEISAQLLDERGQETIQALADLRAQLCFGPI